MHQNLSVYAVAGIVLCESNACVLRVQAVHFSFVCVDFGARVRGSYKRSFGRASLALTCAMVVLFQFLLANITLVLINRLIHTILVLVYVKAINAASVVPPSH